MVTTQISSMQAPTLSINRENGKALYLYFEPLFSRASEMYSAIKYAVFRSDKSGDNFFNHLSIPGEIGDNLPGLDAINKRDRLGDLSFVKGDTSAWEYNGNTLSESEQEQVANYIKNVLL